METGPRETDRYGRLLYFVYTADGASIDAALVREGLAKSWTETASTGTVSVGLERGSGRNRARCLW